MKREYQVLTLGVLGVLLAATVLTARAAVDLLYFNAWDRTDHINLEWETAQEIDNAGFYIQRSLSLGSGYSRITDFIPSAGDMFAGAYYTYDDSTVEIGITYYYKLESVDAGGNSQLTEPTIGLIEGNTATPTPTPTGPSATPTATLTATPSPTGPTPTYTSTPVPPTITPTRAPTTPPAATATSMYSPTPAPPTKTFTPAYTPTRTPTTTLVPLPAITLIFPLPTATNSPTPTPRATATYTPTPEDQGNNGLNISPRIMLLILVVALLWLFLAGFIILYVRYVGR